MLGLLMEANWRYGNAQSTPLDVTAIQELADIVVELGIDVDDLRRFIARTSRPTNAQQVGWREFLEHVRSRSTALLVGDIRRSQCGTRGLRQQLDRLRAERLDWEVTPLQASEIRAGRARNKPLVFRQANGDGAVGAADLTLDTGGLDCERSTIPVTFVRVSLVDCGSGAPVQTTLAGTQTTMTLTGGETLLAELCGGAD